MRQKKCFSIILRTAAFTFLAIWLMPLLSAAYTDLPEVDIQARSAILVHADTGEILFSHNIHIRREPASITKIMTVLLGLEYGGLDEIVTAQAEDFADMTSDSSNAGITEGEQMPFIDLLKCALISSANEACNIIARHVAGSVPAFMEMINARLTELGCENSQFTNPHGLPHEEHYTTAYDIYLMARECMKNPLFMEIAHTEIENLAPTNKTPEGRTLITTNHLITRRKYPGYIYPYARGIKTGSTNAAGHCLLSAAEKNGLTLISVVLGATVEEDTNTIRSFTETRDLFEWGFENFTMKKILGKNEKITSVKVTLGLNHDEIFLVPDRAVETLVPNYLSAGDVVRTYKVYEPDGVEAPVGAGDVLGEMTLSYQGHEYGKVLLLADKSVERDNREALTQSVGGFFSQGWVKWVIIGAAALIALYALLTVSVNLRRRRNMRPSNYRGKKRR